MEVYQWLAIINLGSFATLVVDLLIWWLCIRGNHSKLWGAIVLIVANIVLDVTGAFSGSSDIWLIWLWSVTVSFSFLFLLRYPRGIRGMMADKRSRNKTKQEKD
jgi:hypothetical protein